MIRAKTPLHQAAMNGHEDVVELLIANGAQIEPKAKDGFDTPISGSFLIIIRILLDFS